MNFIKITYNRLIQNVSKNNNLHQFNENNTL